MQKTFSALIKSFIFLTFLLSFTGLTVTVEAAAQVDIVSHIGYIDSLGYYNVVGEVHNVGDQTVSYVEIRATFYDTGDAVVGTSFSFSDLTILLPDRKAPFRIMFVDTTQSLKVDHYSLNVDFTLTTSIPEGLEILSHSSYIDTLGYMHIVGEVQNNANSKATFVEVIATCYDQSGSVVEEGFTFSDPGDIETGDKAPFEILILGENVELVNSYQLTVESRQYAEIPEVNSYLLLVLTISTISFFTIIYKRKIVHKKRHNSHIKLTKSFDRFLLKRFQ